MPPASRPPTPRPSSGGTGARSAPRSGRGAERPAQRQGDRGARTGGTPTVPRSGAPSARPAASPAGAGKGQAKGTSKGAATGAGKQAPSFAPASKKASAASGAGSSRTGSARRHPDVHLAARGGGRGRGTQEPTGWLRVFTVRSAVLVLVALMAFVLVAPTAVQYMKQRDELRALEETVDDTLAANIELENELARWGDDKYVIAQARERLTFVFPGETPYRVIDPETVVEQIDPQTGHVVEDGPVTVGLDAEKAWYSTVWDTVQVAGNAP